MKLHNLTNTIVNILQKHDCSLLRMQTIMEFLSIVYISLFLFSNFVIAKKKPNIVLIVADDLGYNDVSWHNPDIISPNLAKLAEKGIILENHYVQPICTPTRSALMTGYYPIHTGRQVCNLFPESFQVNYVYHLCDKRYFVSF